MTEMELKSLIRDIPDFPKPGILFRDITPLLASPDGLRAVNDAFVERVKDLGITKIAAVEARGFLFATPLAMQLDIGLVPVRKPGKLPHETLSFDYELEYGTDTLEIHADAIGEGDKVLIIDDLLATGGTVGACVELIKKAGGEVTACAFVIELAFLGGAAKLGDVPIISLVTYE